MAITESFSRFFLCLGFLIEGKAPAKNGPRAAYVRLAGRSALRIIPRTQVVFPKNSNPQKPILRDRRKGSRRTRLRAFTLLILPSEALSRGFWLIFSEKKKISRISWSSRCWRRRIVTIPDSFNLNEPTVCTPPSSWPSREASFFAYYKWHGFPQSLFS